MTHPHENDHEDSRLAELLRTIDSNVPPPDPAVLAALRERSLQAFAAAAAQPAASPSSAELPATSAPELSGATESTSATTTTTTASTPSKQRKVSMVTLAIRGLAALAATVLATAAWFHLSDPAVVSGAPFSDVLAQLRSAQTLELRVTKDGHSAEVWLRAPGLVRWEDSPTRYRIAAGSRLWKIDETANTATAGDSPWFLGPDRQVDLLGLLELGVTDAANLLKAQPEGEVDYDGHRCLFYAADVTTAAGPLRIEAFADALTRQLRGIVARPVGKAAGAAPPLAELQLVAMNPPIDDAKFAIAKSLDEDGRIGAVNDAQGVVVLRPMVAQRWTPLCRETVLKPGDWLRTDIRGANAVRVRLTSAVELTLGPGTLIECLSPTQARMHTGQAHVKLPEPAKDQKLAGFELLAPRAGSETFARPGKTFLRVDRQEQLVKIEKEADWPKWLAGFEGTATSESLGSLIVNLPDGRNEPLTVGYHKVNVEIRDQIARTTIEESFVNHTDSRLEGVFHFPLPADASISGFGMWIGNDLVEADVVEKQRAREIYETILRERRDPGLLEWTSGNLFKARVFPIEARSEKRVKIVYTQVLPLRANKYRYSYGLRSDLLRTKPLRELSLNVTVTSALPLRELTCPTHPVRLQHADHSARVEFAAQEYSPDRDFEVVCEIDGKQSDVVVVPHRRGSDGYLLVQLMPPGVAGNWQREVLPDGSPVQVVLLCDTSASMDSEKRKQQAEFVGTVLASLGDKDRFMLAAADVATAWASPQPLAPTADNVAQAQTFLEERISLGWTDLDQAFDAVLKKAPVGAQIVYIGDGLVSAGDRDPASFVRRLTKRLAAHKANMAKHEGRGIVEPTLHVVTVGNTHESAVLKGIATVGGGSVRAISGERTAQVVALELLNEISQPGLRDLKVEFRGVKVAAMYPDRLPNLAAGTQQILVGRYLPEGQDQTGEIVVTGLRGTEPVRYAAKINFRDAEEGNSFIPRLWARSHLDQLLQQGSNPTIQAEILALSEEFHIITPYTSLLVLETDADRERFGVKRRYEMRDGERFFQQGADNANFELAQKQMQRAGNWRLNLRRQVLRRLAMMGRSQRQYQPRHQWGYSGAGGFGGRLGGMLTTDGYDYEFPSSNSGSGYSTWEQLLEPRGAFEASASLASAATTNSFATPDDYDAADFTNSLIAGEEGRINVNISGGFIDRIDHESNMDAEWRELDDDKLSLDIAGERPYMEMLVASTSVSGERADYRAYEVNNGRYGEQQLLQSMLYTDRDGDGAALDYGYFDLIEGEKAQKSLTSYNWRRNDTGWLDSLVPGLAGRPGTPAKLAPPKWPADALALAKSLSRLDSLLQVKGGIELETVSESYDPVWKRRSSQTRDLALYSPSAWLTKPINADSQTLVNYCNATERAVFSLPLLLGRTRASAPRELTTPPLDLNDWSLLPLDEHNREMIARVEPAGDEQALLILTNREQTYGRRLLIDTARHVLLKREELADSQVIAVTTYANFVEVAGRWWATSVITTDARQRKTYEVTLKVKQLDPEQFDVRLKAELAPVAQVQMLQMPQPRLVHARQRAADGSASFDDRITMIRYYCKLQQWDEVWQQLDAAEKLAAGKPGVRWLRTVLLPVTRRNEEVRQRLLAEARQLVAKPQPDEVFLSNFLIGQHHGSAGANEHLAFVELLEPVYKRQPAGSSGVTVWRDYLVSALHHLGRGKQALAAQQIQAAESPWATHRQVEYARLLLQAGQAAEAYAWLDKQLAQPVERISSDDDTLRSGYVGLYRTQARWEDLLKFTTTWIARKPEAYTAYQEHLTALVYNDQLDAACALVNQWLKEARVEGKLAADVLGRLHAALAFARGSMSYLSLQWMDDRWQAPLAETVRYFVRKNDQLPVVQLVMGDSNFAASEQCDRLRGEFLRILQTELRILTSQQLLFLVQQSLSGRLEFAEPVEGRKQMTAAELPREVWKQIAAQVHTRWEAAEDQPGTNEKQVLGDALVAIYAARFSDAEWLPFLRERIKTTTRTDLETAYRTALFDALLSRPWTDDIEKEAFQLLPELADAELPASRLPTQVGALHRLVDTMLANRQGAAQRALQDQGETQKLTRKELAAKQAEFSKNAQAGLALRLAELASAWKQQSSSLADWATMERVWLLVKLEQDLDQAAAFCWLKLDEVPPKQPADAETNDELLAARQIQELFAARVRQRALATLMNLAARKNAQPELIDRVLKHLDAQIAAGGDGAAKWRSTKYQLLVALDRPDDLERECRAWIRADATTAPWRKTLALLLAERGQLDEAIQLFEAAEKDKLLSATDYHTLSNWYLVRNRRPDHERAHLEAFRQTPEQHLQRIVGMARNKWARSQDQSSPSELDEDTLLAIRVLLEKSSQPENYLWQLREVYGASRDFRVLQALADGMLGRSAQQVYPFLSSVHGVVLTELRNEAAADEVVARIKLLRSKGQTPTDLRSLDLLEAFVEGRSAQLQNQRGPHVASCLAALKRAFNRPWAQGEPVLMAGLLEALGTMADPKLADEQLRELRELQKAAPANSRDRLLITKHLCKFMYWSYNQQPEALLQLQAEIKSYEQAHQGQMPPEEQQVLDDYVTMLLNSGRHAAGEVFWQQHLERPVHDTQRDYFRERLWYLYNHALEHKGEVSLGKGETLLQALIAYGLKQIDDAPDENVRHAAVNSLVQTFDIAHRNQIPGAAEPLKTFAFQQMPGILKRQTSNYSQTATRPATVIDQMLGPKIALQYAIERTEQWPQRLQFDWNNSWHHFGGEMARYRKSAADAQMDLKDLEPRLLKLAIAELKRELRSEQHRSMNYLFHRSYSYFWQENAEDFAAAAMEVYRDKKNSGRHVSYIATYLWDGLHLRTRAIEILLIAHQDGVLDQPAQLVLIQHLHEENRYAESIPLLEPLVKADPDTITHRTLLMKAYFHTKRPEQLADLIKRTDEHMHQGGRWHENNIAEFARACQACEVYEKAAAYFDEAIMLRRRANERLVNDAALSQWHQELAQAHTALGHTKEAVEAASGAVVCWSARHHERQTAIASLRNALASAKDLDAYVKHLDAETAKSGQDSPLLRKELGLTYQSRSEFAQAVTQFQLARELQPNDREVCQALIACYDALERPAEATRQLLAQLDFDRHNLMLCEQLAKRFKDDKVESERAATSIIEAAPGEAENHQAMAQLRQNQNRWPDAMVHWNEVAQLRRLEPTGLLGLAGAQVHERQWDAARKTLDQLQKTEWPTRFNGELNKVNELRQQLPN